MDTAKIAVGVVAAASVALGLYCLSNDDAPVGQGLGGKALDFKSVHTLEKLIDITDELELELICIYTRIYNNMLKYKERGTWQPEHIR